MGDEAAAPPAADGASQPRAVPAPAAALRPCELRLSRAEDRRTYLICGAGAFVLGTVGQDDAAIAATCAACPIPDALASPQACLHLRPIKVAPQGQRETLFSCRWFYTLNLRRQPRSQHALCDGCPYWFPRPDAAQIPRYWQETEQIRAQVTQALLQPPQQPPTPEPPPPRSRSWWRRALQAIVGWI